MTWEIPAFIVLFLALLTATTWITNKYTGTKEIGNSQLLIALCATAIALLVTKKIKSFGYGDFKVETALIEAQNTPIFKDVNLIPVEGLVVNEKDDHYHLNEEIASNKPDALSFYLGYKNYDAKEMDRYLDVLGRLNLNYIIFDDLETKEFVGIVEYAQLSKQLNAFYPYEQVFSTKELKSWIQHNERATLKRRLNGYISSDLSVFVSTKKLEALQKMEKANLDYLPVIDSSGTFKGVVKRDRLASSVLIEVSRTLQKE